jgi:hypothetical protein
MNYISRTKVPVPTPAAQSPQGETQLRTLQSQRNEWKIFGDYKLPARAEGVATLRGGGTPSLPRAETARVVQNPALIEALPPGPLIKVRQKSQKASFYAIQEWEGYVSRIDGRYLYADLVDLVIGETKPSTTAKIPIREIPECELKRAIPGAIFRWSIGYRRSAAGQQDRVSRIRFRMLKSVSKSQLGAIEKRTEELARYISKD